MIIIGKPDYYDYLSNVYGRDDHVVYDRREQKPLNPQTSSRRPSKSFNTEGGVHLCGQYYPYFYVDKEKKHYWLDSIKGHPCVEKTPSWRDPRSLSLLFPAEQSRRTRISTTHDYFPLVRSSNINDRYNCPVILNEGEFFKNEARGWQQVGDLTSNPLLSELGFSSVLDPDDLYKRIYNWLLERKNEQQHDVLTDKEKIDSHGFDKKQSFRHRRKT